MILSSTAGSQAVLSEEPVPHSAWGTGEPEQRLYNYRYVALCYRVTECYKFYLDQMQVHFNNLSSQSSQNGI